MPPCSPPGARRGRGRGPPGRPPRLPARDALVGRSAAPAWPVAPVSDGDRIYRRAQHRARRRAAPPADGHELWRISKDVTAPMAAAGGLAVPVRRRRDRGGARQRTAPARGSRRASRRWRRSLPRGGLADRRDRDGDRGDRRRGRSGRLAASPPAASGWRPAVDGDRVYAGADDGRVLALDARVGTRGVGEVRRGWRHRARAPTAGRVYVGAGDKQLLLPRRRVAARIKWSTPHRIADLTAASRSTTSASTSPRSTTSSTALDRDNGNQRWQTRAATAGRLAASRVVGPRGLRAGASAPSC